MDELGVGHHVVYALQLVLGGVFVLSVAPKLRDPRTFARTVADYRILGPRASLLAAPLVIAVECALALAFLTGTLTAVALPLAGLTLASFGIAGAINLRRGRDVSCGCFGDPSEQVSARTLVRLGVLLAAVTALALAFATGAASETTLAELTATESPAGYLIDVVGIALVLGFAAVWALEAENVGKALRSMGRRPSSRMAGRGG
jgi:hypothetical protein